jgi:hypothetical protein
MGEGVRAGARAEGGEVDAAGDRDGQYSPEFGHGVDDARGVCRKAGGDVPEHQVGERAGDDAEGDARDGQAAAELP